MFRIYTQEYAHNIMGGERKGRKGKEGGGRGIYIWKTCKRTLEIQKLHAGKITTVIYM